MRVVGLSKRADEPGFFSCQNRTLAPTLFQISQLRILSDASYGFLLDGLSLVAHVLSFVLARVLYQYHVWDAAGSQEHNPCIPNSESFKAIG